MNMKFGRLLAAGKSLVNGNVAGRYQMRQGLALPQFISPKNPFKQEAAAKPVAPSPVAAAPATVTTTELVDASAGAPPVAFAANPPAKHVFTRKPFSRPTLPGASGWKVMSHIQKIFAQIRASVAGRPAWVAMGSAAMTSLHAAAKRSGVALQRAALFCLDHNPFSAIGKPKLAGIPQFGKPVVQTELSLDRVRVVRNDLAHADLEVVRAGSGSK
jgi:hypothetical protein